MAHKKKPFKKGLFTVIDRDTNKECARNLSEEAIEKFFISNGLSPLEAKNYYKIIYQK